MFRLLNVDGRAALESDGGYFDLEVLSGDASLADPMVAIERHTELHDLQARTGSAQPTGELDVRRLGPVAPRPRQVFAIGMNYVDHAAEMETPPPPAPLTFTKFPSCLAGANADVPIVADTVDWEVELVAIVGAPTRHIAVADAWGALAGLTLGQDISERTLQMTGTPPQFGLGKSFVGFGPIGPALVSLDAFDDPADIGLWCSVNGEREQDSRTSQLIYDVPTIVAYLSSVVELYPGDVIFSGTPAGVGVSKGKFLKVGDVLESGADVIGGFTNRMVEGTPAMTFTR